MPSPAPMTATERLQLIDQIHDSPLMVVIAVSGGGVASISDLLLVPGASRTVLQAQVPYSFSALSDLLGYPPEQAVSQEVAEKMALACQVRAEQLSEGSLPTAGGSCTAALLTDRPRRGYNPSHFSLATSSSLASFEESLTRRPTPQRSRKTHL